MQKKNRRGVRVLRTVLLSLGVLTAAALLYLVILLGEPEHTQAVTRSAPLVSPQAAVTVQDSTRLSDAYNLFPEEALLLRGSDAVFVSAASFDAAWDSGYARILQVTYQAGEGTLTLYSVYPSQASALLGKSGLTLSTRLDTALAGMNAVLFTGPSTFRLNAEGENAAYAVQGNAMDETTFFTYTKYITLTQSE